MLIPCQHCRRNPAFGLYRLKMERWTKDGITDSWIEKSLCAECGFNITNFAVAKTAEFEREIKHPNGRVQRIRQEAMYRKYPYKDCVLIEIYGDSVALMREYDAREKAQRAKEIQEAIARNEVKALGRGWRRQRQDREEIVITESRATPRRSSVSSSSPNVAVAPPSVSAPRTTPSSTAPTPRAYRAR